MELDDRLASALREADAEYQAARENASTLRYRLEQEARRQLAEADARAEAAQRERLRLIREAREAGASWGDLAKILGLTRQAAAAAYRTSVRRG